MAGLIKKEAPFKLSIHENDEVVSMLKFKPASDIELKALGEIPDGYIAGWASTPDLDSYSHVVAKGAFDAAISKRGLSGPKGIKLLISHNWQQVGGVIKVLETRGEGLWIEAQLNLNLSYAKDAYEIAKMNGGLNFSVGFQLQDYEFKETDGKVEYLHIKRGDLFEVSVVTFPGNEEATMEYVKGREAQEPKTLAQFEKALVAAGLVKSREDAKKVTQAVKSLPHLFEKSSTQEDEEDKTPVVASQPVISMAKLSELTELVSKMKTLVSSAS